MESDCQLYKVNPNESYKVLNRASNMLIFKRRQKIEHQTILRQKKTVYVYLYNCQYIVCRLT